METCIGEVGKGRCNGRPWVVIDSKRIYQPDVMEMRRINMRVSYEDEVGKV